MLGFTSKKRSRDEPPRLKGRPPKKAKKQREYHSDSEDDEADGAAGDQDFPAGNLLDSDDEDLEKMLVDDAASTSGSDPFEDGEDAGNRSRKSQLGERGKLQPKRDDGKTQRSDINADGAEHADNDDSDSVEEGSEDGDDDDDEDSDTVDGTGGSRKKPSKRNDPTAFATSMSKILSTKLSGSRKADPVLSRSAAAHEASRRAVDGALEAKARRKLAEQRRAALEKGRVRDVLVATNIDMDVGGATNGTGTATSAAEILEAERRLRKVAQRGVIKLFNAVRAAQVKAAETERAVRAEGVIGMGRREEKVAEMTKKGFLDLIAAGGGGLKEGPLEEA